MRCGCALQCAALRQIDRVGLELISYTFDIEGGEPLQFAVDTERAVRLEADDDPAWVRLEHHRCGNCPLEGVRNCPAASDLREVVATFRGVSSTEVADVTVTAPERTYHKRCDVQTALGSLVGLMMATSGCPILSRMRPMARTHLPFSSVVETVFRTTSAYLLGQYLRSLDGETPDYSLVGLARLYEDLNTLNNAFAARLAGLADQDANLNAVSRLFSLSALVTMSVDGGLELVAPLFEESES